MANYFLKVDKELFKMGLNPTEILIISQIEEFQTNTGDCFISDKVLAENFGVSDKTISRTMKSLEDRGYIVRDTKNVKGGRERHIRVNKNKLTTDKMTLNSNQQATICPLPIDNLTFANGQNDFIKDNINKIKEKDNNSEEFQPTAKSSSLAIEDVKRQEGTIENPRRVEVVWLRQQYNNNPNEWLSLPATQCVLHKPTGIYYRRID